MKWKFPVPYVLLALCSVTLALVTAAFGIPSKSIHAAGPHVGLYIMASQAAGSSPYAWCTGLFDPPVHGSIRAIDVFGDEAVTPC